MKAAVRARGPNLTYSGLGQGLRIGVPRSSVVVIIHQALIVPMSDFRYRESEK